MLTSAGFFCIMITTEIEYETFFNEVHEATKAAGKYYSAYETWKGRGEGIRKYGFAVPNREALEVLARCPQPVVEIGAGLAYWARCLQQSHGVEIECFDTHVLGQESKESEYRFDPFPWYPVRKGGPEAITPEHATLLLIWPPYEDPMAFNCLRRFQGDVLVYVGEGSGGCTADEDFHEELAQNWEEDQVIDIPQWYGIHDRMRVYRRL